MYLQYAYIWNVNARWVAWVTARFNGSLVAPFVYGCWAGRLSCLVVGKTCLCVIIFAVIVHFCYDF